MNEEELKNVEIEAIASDAKTEAQKIKLQKERAKLQEQLRNVYVNTGKTR